MRTAHGKPKNEMFKTNIDAENSADQKDLNDMIAEGKRMGLDSEDLGVTGEDDNSDFGVRHKDPLNSEKPTGLDEPGDEPEAPKATEKKKSAIKPEADQEEGESEEDDSEKGDEEEGDESEEGEDDGKPSTESDSKFVTKGELGKMSRDMRRGFKEVAAAMKEIAMAKTPAEKKEAQESAAEVVDDFMTYAQKYKDAEGNPMNTDALKELAGIIEKKVLGNIPLDKIQSLTDLSPAMTQMSEEMSREEIVKEFNTEWKTEGLKTIKERFPNATAEQLAKAEEKMFELATSEKYGSVEGKHDAYPLDYIFLKEGEAFKDLLYSPRKKTAESSSLGDDMDLEDEGDNSASVLNTRFEDMTPKKAAQIEAALGDSDNDDFY